MHFTICGGIGTYEVLAFYVDVVDLDRFGYTDFLTTAVRLARA